MKALRFTILLLLAVALSGLHSGTPSVKLVHGASGPLLQVWSPDTHSNNIQSTDSHFQPGSNFTVAVNVTNAGPIAGFDVTIKYAMSNFFTPPVITSDNQVSLSGGLFDPNGPCSTILGVKQVFGRPLYTVRYAVVYVGTCSSPGALAGTGTLFSIQFDVVGSNTTSIDIQKTGPSPGGLQPLLVNEPCPCLPIPNIQITDMIFQNIAGTLPVPQFTYSPSLPVVGNNITLDASQSFYPGLANQSDRGIKRLIWSFGDATANVAGNLTNANLVQHLFMISPTQPGFGYYSVRLVAIGTDPRLIMREEQVIYISPPFIDNVGVSISIDKTRLTVGDSLGVRATVHNLGNRPEHVSVNITYFDSHGLELLGNESGLLLEVSQVATFNFTLHTSNLIPQVYQLTASVSILDPGRTNANPFSFATIEFTLLPALHDVRVLSVSATPQVAVSTQIVVIRVGLANDGAMSENVSLTAYYGTQVAGSLNGIHLDPQNVQYYSISWDTTGVAPGNYTISATVFLATDTNPTDNSMSDGNVTILPPPTLALSPVSGPSGTQLQVQGSGYPQPPFVYSPSQVIVTFDDQFIGFTSLNNGQFTFTFNIPLSQTGTHTIKAVDSSGARGSASFVVSPPPAQSTMDLKVTNGAIYFPSETAVVFIQANINGQPTSLSNLRVTLVLPNGSNLTLTPVLVAPGEWKASFPVPSQNSFGTYSIVVKARQTGSVDSLASSAFEVKPTWLQAHGSQLVAGLAVLGIVGVGIASWKNGSLTWPRRKPESSENASKPQ